MNQFDKNNIQIEKFNHDGDGKIYTRDGKFLFEVLISDGNEVARRLNLLAIEDSKQIISLQSQLSDYLQIASIFENKNSFILTAVQGGAKASEAKRVYHALCEEMIKQEDMNYQPRVDCTEKNDKEITEDIVHWFGEIMAVMHGDGGHYLHEHGPVKSAKDAMDKYFKKITKIDELQYELKRKVGRE